MALRVPIVLAAPAEAGDKSATYKGELYERKI